MNKIVREDLEYITSANLPWHRFDGKVILISGANGFLPVYLVETLLFLNQTKLKKKLKVIGIVRNEEKARRRFAEYSGRTDLQIINQDICKFTNIEGEVNYIIHAASQASPKYYGVDPVGTLLPNVLGTYNLLELSRIKKVEGFLFFSSGEIYGAVSASQMYIEENGYGIVPSLEVRSCYAESKRMGETMCISWFHQYNVPVKIVRPFHTYGPGMILDDGRVFADFISDIVNNRDIVMKSDGSAIRAFCYLADATLGFLTVLLKGINGEAYNVGNDKGRISILNLANLLVDLFPDKRLKMLRSKTQDSQLYLKSKLISNVPDIAKVRNLGWEPAFSIEEGFKRTVLSFCDNKTN